MLDGGMIDPSIEGRQAFILANTRLQQPPHTPEIALHLADEITPIWKMTEEALAKIGWKLAPDRGGYGGYQAIERWPGRYAGATEMRKDGVALAY